MTGHAELYFTSEQEQYPKDNKVLYAKTIHSYQICIVYYDTGVQARRIDSLPEMQQAIHHFYKALSMSETTINHVLLFPTAHCFKM